MRNHFHFSATFVIVAACSAAAGQTAPATRGTIAPVGADYSTPKAAIKTFLTAPDEASLRAALVFAPDSQADAEVFLAVMVATTKLQKAAEAQFGSSAEKYFSTSTKEQIDARVKALDKATVDVSPDGTRARVVVPANEEARQSAATIELHKSGGNWKIDAASLFGIDASTKEQTATRVAVAKSLTQVTNVMIQDLPKFTSPAEAFQEFWKRSNDAANHAATQSK